MRGNNINQETKGEVRTKSKLRCKTPAKAQVNFRKRQRTRMNRAERRRPLEDRESIPLIQPTILFDEETCNKIDWGKVYPF